MQVVRQELTLILCFCTGIYCSLIFVEQRIHLPFQWQELVWNQQTETAEQLQGRQCSARCFGTQLVKVASPSRCLQCFPCTCDEHCDKHGTCCPGKNDPWQPPPIELAECRKADGQWILHVTTCDPAYPHNQTRFLCESKALPRRRDTVLPVTSRATGVTYANRHCAQCHHDLSHLEEWTMTCLHNQYLYNITNDTLYDDRAILLPDICRPSVPSSIDVSQGYSCLHSKSYYVSTPIISTCNVTGDWQKGSEPVRKACEESEWSRGAAVTIADFQTYTNVLCAMCNENPILLDPHCYADYMTTERELLIEEDLPLLTHTDLIGFSPPVDHVFFSPKVLVCPEKQWNHPQDGCQKLQCSAGKVLGPDNTCTTPVERITGLGYHLRVLLVPVSVMVDIVRASMPANIPPASFCSYSHSIKRAMDETFSFDYTYKSVTLTTAPVQNGTCFFSEYRLHLERLWADGNKTCWPLDRTKERCEVQIGDSNRHAASFLAAMAEVDIVSSSQDPRDVFESRATEMIFRYWNAPLDQYTVKLMALDLTSGIYDVLMEQGGLYDGVLEDVTRFPHEYMEGHQNPLTGLELLFLPLSKSLLCPHLTFNEGEFNMKKSDRDLQISFPFYLDSEMRPVSFSAMYYPDEVWLEEDQQLSMCFNTFEEVFPHNVTVIKPGPGVSKVRQVLSVVCGSMSVVCLALTFFTYCLFRELRSLPGLNNMGLSLSLAAAQLSLLTDWLRNPDIKPLCISVGVFTHWLWLMAILWMGVCCLHMRHVFTSKTRHALTQRETKKAFLRNILFTVLGSAGIVIITIVVSASVSGGSSIGYGGWKCFLDTSLHRLLILAFVVPLGVVVLTNLVCFFFTVVAIVRMRRLRAEDRSGRGSRQVLIYAKLSTVTGVGWVLALLGQVHRSEWMLVLTELCTGLQGLLIFLAFVCNRRVWNLYRSMCCSLRRPFTSISTPATAGTLSTNIRANSTST